MAAAAGVSCRGAGAGSCAAAHRRMGTRRVDSGKRCGWSSCRLLAVCIRCERRSDASTASGRGRGSGLTADCLPFACCSRSATAAARSNCSSLPLARNLAHCITTVGCSCCVSGATARTQLAPRVRFPPWRHRGEPAGCSCTPPRPTMLLLLLAPGALYDPSNQQQR